ncbi:MAG TPA: TRAP transporter substrate-binding protein [Candidatus Sulfotelmatobacter sp.]|nr:TRAP transporter substrate-binding protein [Candidatus Sulfotelmatobacter sp.]
MRDSPTNAAALSRRKILHAGAAAAALAATRSLRAHATDAIYTLRLSSWGAPGVPQVSVYVPEFTKRVSEGSQGRIAVQHFPAGSLVKEQDVASAIQAGVVDISLSTIGSWASTAPTAALLNSILFSPTDAGFATLIGPGTKLYGMLADDLAKRSGVLLGTIDNGAPVVVSRAPINGPGDFRGKTVRVYDRLTSQIVQTLGGAPSTIQVTDVYPALERGTVQAAIGGLQGEAGLKVYEVAKYLLLTNGVIGTGITFYVMNKAALARLPADLQHLVVESGEAAGRIANDAVVNALGKLRQVMADHGMTVTELELGTPAYEAFVAALKPLADQQRAHLSPALLQALSAKS